MSHLLSRIFVVAFAALAVLDADAAPSHTFSFDTGEAGWTAERGRITIADGKVRLQPDANRRVVLLSPPALPETTRSAAEFVIGIDGTGLQRVRIQGRRDGRGGWMTLADARGDALRRTPEGVTVKRTLMRGSAAYDRLRIEMEFRTTNPRALERIVVNPAP
jgi:hypothetical protein